jgi:hypothetical protein
MLANPALQTGIAGLFGGGSTANIGNVLPNIGSWYDSYAQEF